MNYFKYQKRPPSGQLEEISFDNQSGCSFWHWAKFKIDDSSEWYGAFRSGNVVANFLIASLETEKLALIVSGGSGYLINTAEKKLIKILSTSLITDLFCDSVKKNFIVADFYGVSSISLDAIETNYGSPIESDGIKFDKVKNQKLPLVITEAGEVMRINMDYCFDLDKYVVEKLII